MIRGVDNTSSLSYYGQNQPVHSKPPAKAPAPPGQDRVALSGDAQAAGDADHDGDSK